jgi:pimeloyl-ACP methyl ester carboxylesterase
MVATLIRWVIATEWLGALAFGVWLATFGGWPGWLALLGALALPVLMHGSVIGLQSLVGAWQRRQLLEGMPRAHRAGSEEVTGLLDPAIARAAESGAAAISAAPPSALEAIRAWLGETFASLRSFMLLMPWYGDRPLPSGDDPARLPVVLVHGYFCNRAIWRPMARRLAQRGHAINSPNLEPPLGDIEDYLGALEEAVERLRSRTGAERVALVGHSMGGIVIRAWLRRYGAERVAGVVTLGSPHRGTWSAQHALGRNVQQMRQGSPWLTTLARSESPAVRRLFTVIVTLHDNIVMPQVPQDLDDAPVIVLRGIGHVALAQKTSVFDHVFAALDRASIPLTKPGPSERIAEAEGLFSEPA